MPRWIETELKLLLPDEAAWQRVRTALGEGTVVFQVNHFFDHPDGRLRAARIGVRLRAEDGSYRLAVKGERSRTSEGAVAQRIELESGIAPAEAEAALALGLDLVPWIARWRVGPARDPSSTELTGFLDTLEAACRDRRLERYAGFGNRRESLRLALCDGDGPFEVELALDRTTLPGGRIDHEIEIEFASDDASGREPQPGRVEAAVRRWLRELGVIAAIAAPSKLARLHQQLAAADTPPVA